MIQHNARQIPGLKHYFATTDGQILSKYKSYEGGYRVLKPQPNKKYGHLYVYVKYIESEKSKRVGIHRLVAKTYLDNPGNKPQVNHKDSNPGNNKVENLEWVTAKENTIHSAQKGRMGITKGESSPNSRFKEADILNIRTLYANGCKQTSIAKIYDTYQANISRIVLRKSWRHL